jgi:hypothetical protein
MPADVNAIGARDISVVDEKTPLHLLLRPSHIRWAGQRRRAILAETSSAANSSTMPMSIV